MSDEKKFPDGMVPLRDSEFTFRCHPGVRCFTVCCKKVDIVLFPYDVLRLKQALKITSEEFMRKHTSLVKGDNPFFPSVMLKLTEDESKACPFLLSDGCSVYPDRPSACRTYPLERAVDRQSQGKRPEEFYFLTHHDYCFGHEEDTVTTAKEFVRNQRVDQFNIMNDLWAELDTIFRENPWKGEGAGGPKQQMAFMVCYDIDGFREYVSREGMLKRFRLNKDQRKRMKRDDAELQKFGFEWLKLMLTGKSSLVG